jgi:hypothetical protein
MHTVRAPGAEARPGPIELRLPIDGTEAPFAYPDADGCLALEVALSPGGYASLVLPTDDARRWAGDAFAALSVAYAEATGDPHALSEEELAALPPATTYHLGAGLHLCAEGEHPAVMRFHLVVDLAGECLDEALLRSALVEELSERFKVARVGVSAAFALSGRPS